MSSGQEKHSTEAQKEKVQSKKRVQLKHAVFDVDFFQKPKIIALQFKFGHEGVVCLMDCLCHMSRGTDAEIPKDCLRSLARKYEVKDAEAFMAYCLELKILVNGSSDLYISNTRVIEDQEAMAKKQDEWRTKKRQQRDKIECPSGRVNNELLKNEDLKNEDQKKLSKISNEAFNAIKRWEQHRHKLKLSFDEMAADALQMQYSGRSEDLVRDINASITAGWRNIREAPLPEEKRIEVAATAKAKALQPQAPPRPKIYKPDPRPPPADPQTVKKWKEDLEKIGKPVLKAGT